MIDDGFDRRDRSHPGRIFAAVALSARHHAQGPWRPTGRPGVIEAFYAGLDEVRLEDFDYLCKLDMDLDLPVRYFEILMERMERNPRIGTNVGKPGLSTRRPAHWCPKSAATRCRSA